MNVIAIIGLKSLLGKLSPDRVKGATEKQIKEIVLKLEGLVKKATPVDTARLRSSITHGFKGEGGWVGTNVYYGRFVEYGTAKMEARHVEGSSRVYGQGMFAYGLKQLDLKDVEAKLAEAVEKEWD